MKIFIPILSFGKAGGYRVLSRIATELVQLGNEVIFLCPDGSDKPYFPTSAKIYWINKQGQFYEDDLHQAAQPENFFSIQRKIAKALSGIKAADFDIILANHSLTILPIRYNRLQKKTVYYVQAYEPEMYEVMGGFKNKILEWLSAISYSPNIYTVVNADIYKKYKRLQSSYVLYPGLDFEIFTPVKEKILNNNKIIIGTVGRLEKFKGTTFVLEAFKKIRLTHPGTLLYVAYGKQEDFIGQEGIVCFEPTNDAELADFYRSLDFYCCGGYMQLGAFHYPIAEAMACGISVITTQYYPANNNNAWIVKSENAEDIANKFDEAMNNLKAVNVKRQAGLKDAQQFNWKKMGLQLNSLLKQFLHK